MLPCGEEDICGRQDTNNLRAGYVDIELETFHCHVGVCACGIGERWCGHCPLQCALLAAFCFTHVSSHLMLLCNATFVTALPDMRGIARYLNVAALSMSH